MPAVSLDMPFYGFSNVSKYMFPALKDWL